MSTTATATATTTTTTPARMTMRDIRAAMPQYFSADTALLVNALTDKGARVEALAQALTGAALERAQSGNMPKVWATVQTAAQALKGATKARALSALAYVESVKPGSLSVDAEGFADTAYPALVACLTPEPPTPKAKGRDYKAELALMAQAYSTLYALAQASMAPETIAHLPKPVTQTA